MKKMILLLLTVSACTHTNTHTHVQQLATTYVSSLPSREIDSSVRMDRVAFGSCANQDEPQPIWKAIEAARPDLFLFTGDNIYGSWSGQQPIAEQYRKLDQVKEYRVVREKVPFMATWDDHDFGQRDGGNDWSGKDAARTDFTNYWTYTRTSLPLEQGGVYHAKILGPKSQRTQVIMLDTRYYRSPLKERPGFEGKAINYIPQDEGTILGEAQWQWLEAELKKPAEVRFVVSSIQLIADDPKFEKWGNFPKERQRFFDLIKSTRAKNVVLISGDRHIASIAKLNLPGYGDLYDVTASSLNRPNKYPDADSHYVGSTFNQENFGLAEINWQNKKIFVQIRDLHGAPVNTVEIKLK